MKINSKKKHYADKLVTPLYLFKLCQKRWGIKCNIDTCATEKNRKCRRFISKQQDFLKQWNFKKTDVLWGNFPHSQNRVFVKHISEVCKKIGCRAVLLLPINTLCSDYAEKYILPYVKISRKIIIKGRHKFLSPIALKVSKEPSVNGYVTVFYNKRRLKC